MKIQTNMQPKTRRGLSSIVGALIFVVLMIATFSVLGVALNSQTQIVDTNREIATTQWEKNVEDFTVDIFTDSNEVLTVNVNNLGQNPVEIFSLVITNQTDFPTVPSKVHDITGDASYVAPGSIEKNIVANTPMKLDLATDAANPQVYTFKVISSLGNLGGDTVICGVTDCLTPVVTPGSGGLTAVLYMDGPNGINTKNSTAVMFVTNISDAILTDVQPVNGFPTPDCDNMWTVTNDPVSPNLFTEDISPCNISPDQSTPRILNPYESTIFVWDGTVAGDVGAEFRFCNSVRGDDGVTLPFVSSGADTCDYLTVIDPNDCGGCEGGGDDDILDERFITRPELFLTIPSPYGAPGTGNGTDTDRALWGANVVNPTDTTMFIHKVTITAFPPASSENFNVVGPGGNQNRDCKPQDISPGNGTVPSALPLNPQQTHQADEAGSWSCPGSNTIMWRDYLNPIELAPQSTFPFLVKLMSDAPISSDAESVLVDSTVYTTSGSFGKGNYQSTAYGTGLYGNIYATSDWQDPHNIDKIVTTYADILSGSTEEFSIVLTDFDTDDATYINGTSKIVVNVPRAFTGAVLDMTKSYGLVNAPDLINPELGNPSVTIHPDDTTQIIAELVDHIGDENNYESAVLTFRATAPVVTNEKLMVMYTLGNGVGTNDNSVGPLTEIILAVIP